MRFRSYDPSDDSSDESGGRGGLSLVFLLVPVIVIGALYWFFFGFWFDVNSRQAQWFTRVFLQRLLFPGWLNPIHFTWVAWFFLAFVAGFLALGLRSTGYGKLIAGLMSAMMFIVSIVVFCFNFNDHSASYAGSTTFVVEDTDDLPNSLNRLARDASRDINGCALYEDNGMRGCIQEGTYDFAWDARVSSVTGAEVVLSRSSGGVSNTQLLQDTLTYIYGPDGTGAWTAIRDGKSRQPVYGVSSWAGKGNVQTCTFSGAYEMNKAFGGRWGTNLADVIADDYAGLFYHSSDRYGYCDGDKPVVVIPVKEHEVFNTRVAFRAAGVLVITGSPSGEPNIQHVASIKPGDYPGPVYPASLVKDQRESMDMIAGITDGLFGKFGYETTDSETQLGNASEYLLRDTATGRLYWVTPMKPRGDTQVLNAYSLVRADEANGGSLNEQRIYVLPDNDPRTVNLDELEARTRQALTRTDPGFFSAKGKLAEFLPLDSGTWQVYAELGSRVVYRITVPTNSDIQPTVYDLDPKDEPESLGSSCAEDLNSLSDQELASCLSDIASELGSRQDSE